MMDQLERLRKRALKIKTLEDHVFKKSLWQQKSHDRYEYYCPLCEVRHALPLPPNPWKVKFIWAIATVSFVFTAATFPWFEWKGLVSFLPLWAVFEFVYRTQVRVRVVCDQCGFDPVLFLSNEEKAKSRVESFFTQKVKSSQLKGESELQSSENSGQKV